MRVTKLLILTMTMCMTTVFAQERSVPENTQNAEGTSLVLPQIQVIPIQDSNTERNYELYIELPEDYSENNNKKYPVLYYTDAVWHLEMLSGSTEFMLEDVILVGISWQKDLKGELAEFGAHASRFRDYSIQPSGNPETQAKYQLGQAGNHLDFIRNEVITYVDNTYRTDTNSRTYFGYSLSGEFGAYILMTQPDTFNNYIIGSPTIKNELDYLSELNTKFGPFEASNRNTSLNANVFISYGSLEDEEVVEPIEKFVTMLSNRRDNGLSIKKAVIEGSHQTAFPMTAVRSVAWLSSQINHGTTIDSESRFFEIPQLKNAFINAAPEDRNEGLVVGELGVDGGDKEMILSLAKEIADHKHGRYDSFLIMHKNKLLFESYYARGRIDIPHFQASATKAYTSMLVGRAIQLGYLSMEDLDKPLVNFLKDLDPSKFVEGAETITLNHALTMRSGIRISEEQKEKMDKNPEQLKGQGRVQALLERSEPITEESQIFKYGDDPDLVMQVIEIVVPGSAMDFIKSELLDKLEITNYHWRINEVTSLPEAGWLTSMTSRDMVKLGTLAMNKGKWKGEQLISEAFITKATDRILLTGDDDIYGGGKDVSEAGYGYFWWSANLKSGDKSYYSTSAQGGFGQLIILVEELDLMIVFTAHDNDANYLQLTAERIIPAFIE